MNRYILLFLIPFAVPIGAQTNDEVRRTRQELLDAYSRTHSTSERSEILRELAQLRYREQPASGDNGEGESPAPAEAPAPEAMKFTSVSWPDFLTNDGACYTYHLVHRGLLLEGSAPDHRDSISYTVPQSDDSSVTRVVGRVVRYNSRGETIDPAAAVARGILDASGLEADKTLEGGRERKRRAGEPNQL